MKWFAGALLILLAALVLESGLLAYGMYVLLGTLILSRVLARSWIKNLSATRTCELLAAEIDDRIDVTVEMKNRSLLPIPWLLVEDLIPQRFLNVPKPPIRTQGKRFKICMIRGWGEATLQYQLRFERRGYYQIGPLLMETGDVFGLHRRYHLATLPHFILVYPKVMVLLGYDLASRRPVGEIRLTHRLYEDPTRISGIREYQPGDPLNRVHWKATARTGALQCKLYEPSTMAGATIVLDLHEAGYHTRGEPYRSDLAVTTAASLAHALFLMGQPVGLITNGRDAAERIRLEGWEQDPRSRVAGREAPAMADRSSRLEPLIVPVRRDDVQFQRIREVLARVERTDGLTVDQLIFETLSRLPRSATVMAILSDVTPESALALGHLYRRGFAVSVILIALDSDQLEKAYGRLRAESLPDIRHVQNEESIPIICQGQTGVATDYQLVTEY